MVTETSEEPVHRSGFASRDADEVAAYVTQTYVDTTVSFGEFGREVSFRADFVDGGVIASDNVRSSVPYGGDMAPWEFFCSSVLRSGAHRVTTRDGEVRLGAGDSILYHHPGQFEFLGLARRSSGCRWSVSTRRPRCSGSRAGGCAWRAASRSHRPWRRTGATSSGWSTARWWTGTRP